jgi:hypothetical protein
MTAELKTEVIGIRDAVNELKRTEPEIFKEFRRSAKTALAPIVDEAKQNVNKGVAPLSGMSRVWGKKRGRPLVWSTAKAKAGIKVSIKPSKTAFLSIVQKDPWGSIYDIAGRSNASDLSRQLDKYGRASRGMWPAALANQDVVTRNLAELVETVAQETNKRLRY